MRATTKEIRAAVYGEPTCRLRSAFMPVWKGRPMPARPSNKYMINILSVPFHFDEL